MAGSGPIDALTHPTFPSAIDARDRHWGWFLLTLGAGALFLVVVLIVVAILQFAAFWVLSGSASPAPAAGHLMGEYLRLTRTQDPDLSDSLEGFALLVLPNVLMFTAPVVLAAVIGRRPFRLYLTAAPRFRWGMMWSSMLVMAIVLLPLFSVLSLFDPERQAPPILSISSSLEGRAIYLGAALLFLLPAAAAEEILFRGWVLRQATALLRWPWLALIVNGLLFALAHANPNLDDTFQLGMMGAAFGYMALRLGGIEFATGAHAINNILLVLFFENLPFTPTRPHPFDPASFAGAFVTPLACVVVAELVVRWPRLRRLVGYQEDGPQEAPAFT